MVSFSLCLRPRIHNTHNKQEKCDELVEDDDKLSDIADNVILGEHNNQELVHLLQQGLLCDDSCHSSNSNSKKNNIPSVDAWWWFRKGNDEDDIHGDDTPHSVISDEL